MTARSGPRPVGDSIRDLAGQWGITLTSPGVPEIDPAIREITAGLGLPVRPALVTDADPGSPGQFTMIPACVHMGRWQCCDDMKGGCPCTCGTCRPVLGEFNREHYPPARRRT